jgi:uncharacterized membrane protein
VSVSERIRSYSAKEIAILTFGLTPVTAIVIGMIPALEILEPLIALVPIVGWFLLTPMAHLRGWGEQPEAKNADEGTTEDPVEHLRARFAEGEIDEIEFERQLELLMMTEDTEPKTAHERITQGRSSGHDRAVERNQ